jgi:hypothetical protein
MIVLCDPDPGRSRLAAFHAEIRALAATPRLDSPALQAALAEIAAVTWSTVPLGDRSKLDRWSREARRS